MVRDQALALGGLLSRKIGGPSVFPPQPDGLWQAAFNGQRTWSTSRGDDQYRRGLYVFWRRTVPYPSMAAFDAPSREICAIKRVRTNTPLQSFVTMNDPVYVEAAQAPGASDRPRGGIRRRQPRPLCSDALPVPAAAARAGRAAGFALHGRARPIPPRRRRRDGPGHRADRPAAGRDGARRPRRLDGRRQRPPEPRQRPDQGVRRWRSGRIATCPCPGSSRGPRPAASSSSHSQAGLGAIALAAMLLERDGRCDRPRRRAAPRPTTRWRPGRRTSRRGEAGDLPAHVGRAAAAGPVRLQARAGQAPHAALPRRAAQGAEVRLHQGASQAARLAVQVRQMRAERRRRSASSCRTSAGSVDDVAIIKSMWTDQFNHAPAELFLYTGSSRNGGAAMGSWITYGLGTREPGPARLRRADQRRDRPDRRQGPLEHRLPAQRLPGRAVPDRRRPGPLRQRPEGDGPLRPPPDARRAAAAQRVRALRVRRPRDADADQPVRAGLPHADGRARRDGHPPGAGADPSRSTGPTRARRRSRTTACWPAGWSSGACGTSSSSTGAGTATAPAPATTSSSTCRSKCREIDRPIAALLADLKRRGLLDETLVIWGGEFGRTSMNEARGGSKFLGRDHHPHCFTIWMAGGGIKPGITVGATDELGYTSPRTRSASTTSRRRSSTCWASTPGSSPMPTRDSTRS